MRPWNSMPNTQLRLRSVVRSHVRSKLCHFGATSVIFVFVFLIWKICWEIFPNVPFVCPLSDIYNKTSVLLLQRLRTCFGISVDLRALDVFRGLLLSDIVYLDRVTNIFGMFGKKQHWLFPVCKCKFPCLKRTTLLFVLQSTHFVTITSQTIWMNSIIV